MIIAVISDTHRQHHMIEKVSNYLNNIDLLIHLGDNISDLEELSDYYKGEIISVKGNCDFSVFQPSERIEIISGKKFFITHGHNYDVKSNLLRLKYKALEVGADVVLFGHTHISEITFQEGIWFINPGSVSVSRNGPNSMAFIEIRDGNIYSNIKSL